MTQSVESIAALVLAPPRSGTSAISHFLSNCGFNFGDPAHFVDTEVHRHNPIFFELEWVNRLNDEVLARFGSEFKTGCPPDVATLSGQSLDDLSAKARRLIRAEWPNSGRIGIKDPRFCFTLPFWQPVLRDLGYSVKLIWSLRSPAATIASNARLVPDWSVRRVCDFWKRCVLGGRHVLGDSPFAMLDYDWMSSDPLAFAADALPKIGIDAEDLSATVSHVSARLHHETATRMAEFPEIDELDARFRAGLVSVDEYPAYRQSSRIINADADLMAMAEKIRLAEVEFDKLSRERIALIQSLEGQLEHRTDELKDLRKHSSDLIEKQATHIQKLESAYGAAELQRAAADEARTNLQALLEETRHQSSDLVNSQTAHIKKLEAECVNAQGLAACRAEHIQKLESIFQSAEAHRSGLQLQIDTLRQQCEQQSVQSGQLINGQSLHIAKLESLYSQTEHQRASMADSIAILRAERTAREAEIQSLVADLEARIDHQQTESNGLRKSIEQLTEQLETEHAWRALREELLHEFADWAADRRRHMLDMSGILNGVNRLLGRPAA